MIKKIKNTIRRWSLTTLAMLLAVSLSGVSVAIAQTTMSRTEIKKQRKEGRDEVREATKVFRQIMDAPDKTIPRELLERAEAVGVFPNVVKAGFIVGGRGGDGVVSRKMSNGSWSAPAFYNIGGASFGAQIGAKKTDYIMLFMNEGALRDLLDDKLEFEGDLSFAAGPVGRTLGAGTNATLDAGILIYSRSEGAFIGASIGGAVLTADNSINEAFYEMKAGELLDKPMSVRMDGLAKEIKAFSDTVARYAGNSRAMNLMSDQTNNATFVNASYATDQRDRNREFVKMRSPQRLAREIRNELLTLPYYSVFDWLEFDVNRAGVVTLRGQVTTPPDTKSRAEAYVKDVEGVSGVINDIEVLPVSPNDDRLRQTLYREIYSGPLFRYQVGSLQNIHIIVKNGRATLKGVVDSEADKNLAGIRAKTVSGLFEVNNELAVRDDRKNLIP